MTRASTYTLLPLDRAAEILQLDKLHFASMKSNYYVINFDCDDVWLQFDYQNTGKVSRDALARAIRQAEDRVAQLLGYSLAPMWIENEPHELINKYKPDMYPSMFNTYGNPRSVFTDWGYVIEGGVRATSVIELGATITYSDIDGDGYDETATVVVVTTVTDPEEICIFFPGKLAKDTWEIRPTDVTISGGNATIVYQRHQSPLPELWEKMDQDVSALMINADDDANFLTELDVYRVYNDPSTQLTFYGRGSKPGSLTSDTGAFTIVDERRGIVEYQSATWDDALLEFKSTGYANCNGDPFKLHLSYRAGLVNWDMDYPHKQFDPTWENMLMYYALTLLDTEICGCSNFVENAKYKRTDLSKREGSTSYSISFDDLKNPLGTTMAGIDLWRYISSPGVRLYKR